MFKLLNSELKPKNLFLNNIIINYTILLNVYLINKILMIVTSIISFDFEVYMFNNIILKVLAL